MLNQCVTFNLGFAKVFSPILFDTYFSYHKDMMIAASDYYMYFHVIMLFPLTAILKLINFTALEFLVY